MKTTIKAMALIAVLFIATSVSYAQSSSSNRQEGKKALYQKNKKCDRGMKGHRGMKSHRGMSSLPDLTDDQKAKIKEIHQSSLREGLTIKNKLGELEAQLKTLESSEKSDLSKINAKIDEIGQLKLQQAKTHAAKKQAVRKVLTEEQRLVFDTKSSHRMHKKHGRRHGKKGANCSSNRSKCSKG